MSAAILEWQNNVFVDKMSAAIWEWQNDNGEWIVANEDIEDEFIRWQERTRFGQRVYHCFGDNMSVGVDFYTMTTYCLSSHQNCPNDHNIFHIRRHEAKNL